MRGFNAWRHQSSMLKRQEKYAISDEAVLVFASGHPLFRVEK